MRKVLDNTLKESRIFWAALQCCQRRLNKCRGRKCN